MKFKLKRKHFTHAKRMGCDTCIFAKAIKDILPREEHHIVNVNWSDEEDEILFYKGGSIISEIFPRSAKVCITGSPESDLVGTYFIEPVNVALELLEKFDHIEVSKSILLKEYKDVEFSLVRRHTVV